MILRKMAWMAGCCIVLPALADSPFIIDNAETTDYQHWEAYLYGTGIIEQQVEFIQVPAVELDYGLTPNCELHTIFSNAVYAEPGFGPMVGISDLETGVEYRFLQETDSHPQMSIFPKLEWPTGDARRELGNGKFWFKIPLLAQKSWGNWTALSGIGYIYNDAFQSYSYPYGSVVLENNLSKNFMVGAEFYAQGTSFSDQSAYNLLNLGCSWSFAHNKAFQIGLAHSVFGVATEDVYVGLYWTW
ncbi:MAG: hypothetical protein QM752_07575 [Gammaproteobacteria bacterium]